MTPAFAADAPLHVVFERLSAQAEVREFQKDVLMQALRERFPEAQAVIEAALPQDAAKHPWILSCKSCLRADDTAFLVSGSVAASGDAAAAELYFKVRRAGGKEEAWNVDLSRALTRYEVISLRPFKRGAELDAGAAEVQACPPASQRCALAGRSFSRREDAEAFLGTVRGMEFTREIRAGDALSAQELEAKKIVRSGDTVLVRYAGAGGLSIQTRGRALAAGAQGENVRVELRRSAPGNASSPGANVIEAKISAPGEVIYGF